MAGTRKPRRKPKAARRRSSPKRARKASSGIAPSRAAAPLRPLDDIVKAAARALALPVKAEWLLAVAANLEVNLRMAALVAEFPLPDESEPAPVFTA
jgi:hypothetical protein